MTLLVMTAYNPNLEQIAQARELADSYKLVYLERGKNSLNKLMEGYEGALVVYRQDLRFQSQSGQTLTFHPDTAMLRIKASHDPLRELVGQTPKKVLDLTMGLASDSLVLAAAGHKVTALESELVPYLVVSRGLASYLSGNPTLDSAMRAVKAVHMDNRLYLEEQADDSFDVLYMDPMFSSSIPESQNLAGLAQLANPSRLTAQLLSQMKRVAKEKIILKAHFRDPIFEELGFKRLVRPNQKFHYGVLELGEKK